jgi:cyclic pyranopterin phosphate synthase
MFCYKYLSSLYLVQYHHLTRTSKFLPLISRTPSFLNGQVRLYSTDKTPELTHTDADTGKAKMVSVTSKDVTHRTAQAEGSIMLPDITFKLLKKTTVVKKGDVLTVAQIAGIQAAKQTSILIPLCHPLLLTNIQVQLYLNTEKQSVDCTSVVECRGNTGVEMEALTAVNVALLTVYDMCKAAGHGMEITGVKLKSKTGGKSDFSS